jgi:hypothetical protein
MIPVWRGRSMMLSRTTLLPPGRTTWSAGSVLTSCQPPGVPPVPSASA